LESGLRVKFASVTYFPPTERGVNSPDRGQERGLRRERRKGLAEGGKLDGEDVASGTEEAKAA
jgi:hypothetical protein